MIKYLIIILVIFLLGSSVIILASTAHSRGEKSAIYAILMGKEILIISSADQFTKYSAAIDSLNKNREKTVKRKYTLEGTVLPWYIFWGNKYYDGYNKVMFKKINDDNA